MTIANHDLQKNIFDFSAFNQKYYYTKAWRALRSTQYKHKADFSTGMQWQSLKTYAHEQQVICACQSGPKKSRCISENHDENANPVLDRIEPFGPETLDKKKAECRKGWKKTKSPLNV